MKKKNILIGKLIEALGGTGEEKDKLRSILSDRGVDDDSADNIVERMNEGFDSSDSVYEEYSLSGVRLFNVLERMLFTEKALDEMTLCKHLGIIDDNDMEQGIDLSLGTDKLPVDKDTVLAVISYVSGVDLNMTGLRPYI